MRLIRALKKFFALNNGPSIGRDTSGIALFMVISAVSVLSILVTEFTYIAQINERMAYDGLDQLKAHYLAKSGIKFSLLRLKAYQQVKSLASTLGGGGGATPAGASGGGAAIPGSLLNKIWNFPFFYPIPTEIPGLSPSDKDQIKKFQDSSGLEGKYSALIESESAKVNVNQFLEKFAPSPSPSASPSPKATGGGAQQPPPNPSPSASFNPAEARKNFSDYLYSIYNNKITNDQDFAAEYRDLRFDDLMDGLFAWADRTYQRTGNDSHDAIKAKKAPFYTLSELHMIPLMDDQLFNLFSPGLTVSLTNGININTMQETTLRALVPGMTDLEVKEFFNHRDATDADNTFNTPDDFYTYIQNSVAVFKQKSRIDELKKDLAAKKIQLIIEETQFKITVQAQMNQAVRTIEAWVTLNPAPASPPTSNKPTNGGPPLPPPPPPQNSAAANPPPDSGLKITFMRIL